MFRGRLDHFGIQCGRDHELRPYLGGLYGGCRVENRSDTNIGGVSILPCEAADYLKSARCGHGYFHDAQARADEACGQTGAVLGIAGSDNGHHALFGQCS